MASVGTMKQCLINFGTKTNICSFVVLSFLLTSVLYSLVFVMFLNHMSLSYLKVAYESKYDIAIHTTPHLSRTTHATDESQHKNAASNLLSYSLTTRGAVVEKSNRRTLSKQTLYPLTSESPYVINNPNICTNVSNLKFLIIVHSSTYHFQRRRIIRETWGNKNIFKSVNLRIVFFLGLTINKTTQELIENESVVYGDVVQGNFLDSYHNLTHKGVLAYRWIEEFCQQAEMIVKVDDDVFVNVFILLETYYPKLKSNTRYIMCHFVRKDKSKIHRKKTKWVVNNSLFRGYSYYPVAHCLGYFVLISRDLIRPMYKASYFTPFFWVDDVYLYGQLPNQVGGVKFADIRYKLAKHTHMGLKCYFDTKKCLYLAVIAWQRDKGLFHDLWYSALSQMSPAMQKEANPLLLPKNVI